MSSMSAISQVRHNCNLLSYKFLVLCIFNNPRALETNNGKSLFYNSIFSLVKEQVRRIYRSILHFYEQLTVLQLWNWQMMKNRKSPIFCNMNNLHNNKQEYKGVSQNIFQSYYSIQSKMLKVDPHVPLKETHTYLASFPRFSLIEKIAPKFFPTSVQASKKVADEIRDAIKAKAQKTKDPFILGLATGSTPLKVYKQLIKMVKNGQLSFKNVVTFNLDQYYPITKDNIESYNYYMRENLFNHVDIPPQNINIPDGQIPRDMVSKFCDDYEKKIKSYGGIDLQILGIGRTGHIGFNEPPSPVKSTTRLVYLHRLTRKDAANSFNGIDNVPKCAITMGIQTISKAKRIIIMAWGQNKAYIVKKSIEGPQLIDIPSTFLHNHPDAIFYLDKGAGEELSRFKIPWTIKGDKQDPIVPNTKYWILKMILWLCKQVKKPILRLSFQDYEDHGLSPLVMDVAKGNVQDLNLFAYKRLHAKITGWPLGDRPPTDQGQIKQNFLHKTSIKKQRVLVFSPHPDDDVISMGGTIHRLKDQGHHVMIAYMTTGSNAVHDYETVKYLHFMKDFLKYNKKVWSIQDENNNQKSGVAQVLKLLSEAEQNLFKKKSDNFLMDNDIVRNMKSLIRSSQAKIAVECFQILPKDVYCMQLPFYTHHSKRKDIGQEDKQVLRDLLKITQPTVIYAAGDLADPHGTHRKCLQIILQVQSEQLQKTKANPMHNSLFPHPQKIFLYRGAWEEWDLAMCRVIVPMSPSEVEQKIASILKHQSQKDTPMFPGDDKRQFWMRSKQRNRDTAAQLRQLGFSDYEAVECFVNLWDLINYEQF